MREEPSFEAANNLSKLLYAYPWYHRTSVCQEPFSTRLEVWVEGKNHAEIPKEFMGFKVQVNRVSKRHPCPFGSVKPHPREGAGNKV